MFGSLIDSFENTIAKAKGEREQLDRLLTISTPKEYLLISVTAVFTCLFVIWLWLGSVTHSFTVDGVLIGKVEGSANESNRSAQALVWVGPEHVSKIAPGMSATIVVESAKGSETAIDGKISEVSPLPRSEELDAAESQIPVLIRQVALSLDNNLDLSALNSKGFRLIVQLENQSPIELFRTRPR